MKWTIRSGFLGLVALALVPAANAGLFDDYQDDGLGYESHRTYFVKLETGATLLKLGGDLRLGGSSDSKLDLKDDLDLGDDKTYWARLDFQPFLRHHLRFTYTPMGFTGSSDLDPGDSFFVGGSAVPTGGKMNSDIRVNAYDFAYRWDALYIGEQVTLSPIVGVSLLDGRARIKHKVLPSEVTDVNESESFFVPIPTVGLRMEGFPLHRLGFYGEAKGMTIGNKATAWDAEVGFEFHLLNNVSLNGRYRYAVYDTDVSSLEFKTTLSGPYVGLGFRF